MSLSERVQREHELLEAYKAAQRLAELLEMAGRDPAPARAIRDSLSGRSATSEQTVDVFVNDPPFQRSSTSSPAREP